MKKKNKPKKLFESIFSFFSIRRFFINLFFYGFIVTVSFLLFFGGLVDDENGNIIILGEVVKSRALYNFMNVMFLCLGITAYEFAKRRLTIEKPVNRLLEATKEIKSGNFSVRLKPSKFFLRRNEFDIIFEDFNQMVEELSSIETLKTDFIANVSHEIKTPLAVIQNYTLMLQSQDLTEEERQSYLRNLSDASKRLSELITSILRLNKLENQQIFPQKERFNLSEHLCECLLLFEENIDSKELNIETNLDESIIIEADKELLSLVWCNLFSNAVKFNKQAGTIKAELYKQEDRIVVTVSDTGCGMSEEVQKRIFEKFYQADQSRTTTGNGLGLALAKRVVDIMEGEIKVESEIGKGTTITVEIEM